VRGEYPRSTSGSAALPNSLVHEADQTSVPRSQPLRSHPNTTIPPTHLLRFREQSACTARRTLSTGHMEAVLVRAKAWGGLCGIPLPCMGDRFGRPLGTCDSPGPDGSGRHWTMWHSRARRNAPVLTCGVPVPLLCWDAGCQKNRSSIAASPVRSNDADRGARDAHDAMAEPAGPDANRGVHDDRDDRDASHGAHDGHDANLDGLGGEVGQDTSRGGHRLARRRNRCRCRSQVAGPSIRKPLRKRTGSPPVPLPMKSSSSEPLFFLLVWICGKVATHIVSLPPHVQRSRKCDTKSVGLEQNCWNLSPT